MYAPDSIFISIPDSYVPRVYDHRGHERLATRHPRTSWARSEGVDLDADPTTTITRAESSISRDGCKLRTAHLHWIQPDREACHARSLATRSSPSSSLAVRPSQRRRPCVQAPRSGNAPAVGPECPKAKLSTNVVSLVLAECNGKLRGRRARLPGGP